MSFEEFGLSPELLSGLADVRIEEPTPLHKKVIPSALQGKHMLVKHEADDDGVFLIPALHKLSNNGEVSGTRVLILTPSIERAKAIDETVWAMGYHAQISSASLSMKGNRDEQEQSMKDGAPVVVANPGRLIEILEKTKLKLPHVDLVIIDEAHGMENYNLVSRVMDIMKFVDGHPQMMIFSASNNKATQQLTKSLLNEAEVIGFDEEEVTIEDDFKSDNDSDSSSDKKEETASSSDDQKASGSESEETEQEEEKEKATSDEPFVLDQEEVDRKLAAASVSVVLNPEAKEEENEEEGEDEDSDDADESQDHQDTEASDDDADQDEPATVPEDLTQAYIYVPPRAKISTLLAHLEKTLTDKIVVFAASKRTTDRLFRIIRKKGWGVVSINEGLKEEYYEERFGKFTSGEMKILLVGGLAANEVELDEVKQVINYDVPNEVEEYKYRAELVGNGKAARMISLVSKMDKDDIDEIVKKVGYAPTEIPLPEEVQEKKKKKSNNKGSDKKSSESKSSDNKGSDQKDKRSKRAKSPKKDDKKKQSRSDRDEKEDKRRRKKKPEKPKRDTHGLPRPSYDGLSGGREGKKGKRPTPSKSDGSFGWIKKLFD